MIPVEIAENVERVRSFNVEQSEQGLWANLGALEETNFVLRKIQLI